MIRLAALIVVVTACGHPAAAPPAPPPPPPPKSLQLNQPGANVDVEAGLADGYVTVVDFWMDSCGACHVVGEMLDQGVADEPRVLIRKVDIGDAFSTVAEAYQIGALPHYRVYDKHKRMRYVLIGNDCTKATQIARQLAAEP